MLPNKSPVVTNIYTLHIAKYRVPYCKTLESCEIPLSLTHSCDLAYIGKQNMVSSEEFLYVMIVMRELLAIPSYVVFSHSHIWPRFLRNKEMLFQNISHVIFLLWCPSLMFDLIVTQVLLLSIITIYFNIDELKPYFAMIFLSMLASQI